MRGGPLALPELLPLVASLRAVWGNGAWPADTGFMADAMACVLRTPGPFLDCGSGLSTIVLGVLARERGTAVWSLEQDAEWARVVQSRLDMLGLGNVTLVHAPLELVDGAVWYGFDDRIMPRHFPAVFCDGPSVGRSRWPAPVHEAWRSAVVKELRKRGITFETILLDDAEDPRCPALRDAWHREGLRTRVVVTPSGHHLVAEWPQSASAPAHRGP